MPTDTPPAATSKLAHEIVNELWEDAGAVLVDCDAAARIVDAKLAPVREALKHAVGGCLALDCADCDRAAELLASLCPQPPEAKP